METIRLHTNGRVNGVLRSPAQGDVTVSAEEARRLVDEEKKATRVKPRRKAAPKRAARSSRAKAEKKPGRAVPKGQPVPPAATPAPPPPPPPAAD